MERLPINGMMVKNKHNHQQLAICFGPATQTLQATPDPKVAAWMCHHFTQNLPDFPSHSK